MYTYTYAVRAMHSLPAKKSGQVRSGQVRSDQVKSSTNAFCSLAALALCGGALRIGRVGIELGIGTCN